MEVGPSEPPCRRRLQTALSCYGPKAVVVNVRVKRCDDRAHHVWIREMSENEPLLKHRNGYDGTETRVSPLSWEQYGGYLLTIHAVSGVEEA